MRVWNSRTYIPVRLDYIRINLELLQLQLPVKGTGKRKGVLAVAINHAETSE